MSGDTVVTEGKESEVTDELENTTDDFDADFDAGFTGNDSTATPSQAPEASTTEAGAAEPAAATTEADPAAAAPAQEVPPEIVQVTRAQFDQLMRKAEEVDNLKTSVQQTADKVWGKIGGVERILSDLRAQPAGQSLKLSEEDFAELKAEYPELAGLQMKGLQRVLEKLPLRAAAVDPGAIEKVVQERTATVRAEVIDSNLDAIVDGDWREEVRTQSYKDWVKKQAEDIQALGDSHSLRDASKLLRLYKAYMAAPKNESTQQNTPPASPTRSRVLAAAVTPKGTLGKAQTKPTEDDEFNSGFKSG